ncbi:hypothetical protein ACPA9J_34735 [Pseudomonas aeruginosa]
MTARRRRACTNGAGRSSCFGFVDRFRPVVLPRGRYLTPRKHACTRCSFDTPRIGAVEGTGVRRDPVGLRVHATDRARTRCGRRCPVM